MSDILSSGDFVSLTNKMAPSEECAAVRMHDQALRELVAEMRESLEMLRDTAKGFMPQAGYEITKAWTDEFDHADKLLARAKAALP